MMNVYLDNCKCFDAYEGKHLTTFVKKVEGRTEEECRASCLTYSDLCLSAQYDRNLKYCYLNVKTHISDPGLWKSRGNFVYWFRREECLRNCYFVYHWKRYLLGYNDARRVSYSSFKCLEWCLVNNQFDCQSIDYDRENGACTISRESKDTKPNAWKTHHKLEHFHRVCKTVDIVGAPCFSLRLDATYLINRAAFFKNLALEACQRRCLTAKFGCKSINYDKSTKNCYLNKETHLTRPNWVRNNNKYEYYMRDELCDYKCYYVYNWRRWIVGYNLEQQRNDYTSLQCMGDCYDKSNCESFNYNRNTKVCQLTTASKLTNNNALKFNFNWENFHKVCQTKINDGCFAKYLSKYLQGHSYFVSSTSEHECKLSCLNSEKGCLSVNYNRNTNKCYLSTETRLTKPNDFKTANNMIYWERENICQSKYYMKLYNNRFLEGYNTEEIKNKNSLECVELCFKKTSFICKSVDYNRRTRTCYLSVFSRADSPFLLKPSSSYMYFEKRTV